MNKWLVAGLCLVAGAGLCLVALVAIRWSIPAPNAKTSVVLITIDTLRADAVGFGGGEQQTTPFLDGLAAKGLVFQQAYSPSSWTAPSMASLFTGLSPRSHGVRSGHVNSLRKGVPRKVLDQPVLAPAIETLAERLASAGYTTIGIPANMHLAAHLGFGQGFAYYAEANFISAPEVNAEVQRQLRLAFGDGWRSAWKEAPTFLWVHYFDPHLPYLAREPWVQQYADDFAADPAAYPVDLDFLALREVFPTPDAEASRRLRPLYESEVSYVDDQIRLLDDALGFDDDRVLLVVTADHGEEFGEHGGLGHGATLFDEATRVPLLMHWPSGLREAGQSARLVSLEDVYPTLCALLGLPVEQRLAGRNVVGTAARKSRALVLQTSRGGRKTALRTGEWKMIRHAGQQELFHLPSDPTESKDLASARPEVVSRLRGRLARRLERLPKASRGDAVPVEAPGLVERLRALGYGE